MDRLDRTEGATEPRDEFSAISCSKDIVKGVFGTECDNAFGDSQQEEIMIAEDRQRPDSEVLDVAQDVQ